MSKNGLSKTTNQQHDVAKKGAVKVGSGPFTRNIGQNHIAHGKHPAAHGSAGGKGGHMKGKK